MGGVWQEGSKRETLPNEYPSDATFGYAIYRSSVAAASNSLKIDLHHVVELLKPDEITVYDWGAGDGAFLRDITARSTKRIHAAGCTLEAHEDLPSDVFIGDILRSMEQLPSHIDFLVSNFGVLHLFLQLAAFAKSDSAEEEASAGFAGHFASLLTRLSPDGVAVFNLFNAEVLNHLYNTGRLACNETHYAGLMTRMVIEPVCASGKSALATITPGQPKRDWPAFIVAADTARLEGAIDPSASVFKIVDGGAWDKEAFGQFIDAARADASIRIENDEFNMWRFLAEKIRIDPDDYS